MNWKPLMKLVVLTQIFLLFAVLFMPTLLKWLPQSGGKWLYGAFSIVCIGLAVLLRRSLSQME